MKRNNRVIFAFISSLILIGCSSPSDDLKSINDEKKVIEIAKGILDRQNKESFDKLNNFVMSYSYIESKNELISTHKMKSMKKINQEFSCDLNNFIIKDKLENSSTGGTASFLETYYYYDKNTSNLYTLTNKNGLKTKVVESDISIDIANEIFSILRLKYVPEIKNQSFLTSMEKTITELKQKAEEYKSKTDEYYKYSFGSNDEKSLQLKIENKDKYYYDELDGYITITNNSIMRDDKMSYNYSISKINVKDKENIYYMDNYDEIAITYKYGNVSIDVPNINYYKEYK